MHIEAIHRYPIKGLSPEPLREAALTAGGYFPGDRLFAIENGPSGFDPADPVHQPKIKYLMLMRNESLARLKTRYDDATGRLTVTEGGALRLDIDLAEEADRNALSAFLSAFMPDELRGEPRLLAAPSGYRFTDSRRGFVSLLNLASVAALEAAIGEPVNPLRFRANLHVAGWPAWQEFEVLGRTLAIGEVRLKVLSRIVRCAATDVDPGTGLRDLSIPIPTALMRRFGHADCGIYAEVLAGGRIRPGDTLTVLA